MQRPDLRPPHVKPHQIWNECYYAMPGSCSGERGNVLAVRNYCYVAVCSAARGASAPTEGGEGRGHIVEAARLQLIPNYFLRVESAAPSGSSQLHSSMNFGTRN